MESLKKRMDEWLQVAGIHINGTSESDIRVHNDLFFKKVLLDGSVGLGESYIENWWECLNLDDFFYRVLHARLDEKVKRTGGLIWEYLVAKAFNFQNRKNAFLNAQRHYDLGNELFLNMLDTRLVYTCAYWKDARTLDEAQEAKLRLTCEKLYLQPGMEVLDIGCGWGSFAKYAAEEYGVSVTGITVSPRQVELGRELCNGLPVKIELHDYRELDPGKKYDRIVSLGMFEHVGYKNYRPYMQVARRHLKDGGLFLLHTIGGNVSVKEIDPWINKYIFPNAMLPSVRQIGKAIEGLFVMEDWHNFSADYDKTLMAWYENFSRNWEKIKDKYDDRFFRMWKYYLQMCAGSFRARKNQLWQIVLSKEGVPGGYAGVR